jgi:hypothetical protein
MNGFRLKTTWALGLVALAAAAGCGGDSGGDGASEAGGSAAADPCGLLTRGDAQEALGSAPKGPVRQDNAALEVCRYDAEPTGDGLDAVAGARAVSLSIVAGEATRAMFDSNTTGGTEVAGVGEMAAELGTSVYFVKAGRLYAVELSGDGVTPDERAALARTIASRI